MKAVLCLKSSVLNEMTHSTAVEHRRAHASFKNNPGIPGTSMKPHARYATAQAASAAANCRACRTR